MQNTEPNQLLRSAGATVLVVDDDSDLRESLVDLIEQEGYTAAAVANGKEALDYLTAAPLRPKLILLDLMMPVMDGWELLKEVRQVETFADVEVVIISARYTTLADVSDPTMPLRRMTKPLDLNALAALLKETCGETT